MSLLPLAAFASMRMQHVRAKTAGRADMFKTEAIQNVNDAVLRLTKDELKGTPMVLFLGQLMKYRQAGAARLST